MGGVGEGGEVMLGKGVTEEEGVGEGVESVEGVERVEEV